MRRMTITAIVLALSVYALGAEGPQNMNMKASAAASPEVHTRIQQAMQAAPPDISASAAIMDWPKKNGMSMRQLRPGTNGWICMPSSPAPADGAATDDPICADKAFSALLNAWTTKSDPRLTTVGIAYMLRGDKGASNTDPFAMVRTATNNWIVSPPHVMVAVPDSRPNSTHSPRIRTRAAPGSCGRGPNTRI